jgi:5-methylcytosine-specific restriction endonuclease McrA
MAYSGGGGGMARRKRPRCPIRRCRRAPLPSAVAAGLGLCRTHLVQQADAAFSARVRAVGRCQHCGSSGALQCAHIVSRRYLATRWDPQNAVALCPRCHVYYTHRPVEWEVWIDARRPTGASWQELRRRALDAGDGWVAEAVACVAPTTTFLGGVP